MDIRRTQYEEAILTATPITPEQFIGGAFDDDIMRRISAIVEAEGPVIHAVLAKRLINSYGMQQLGRRLREKFEGLLATMDFPTTVQAGGTVYWKRQAPAEGAFADSYRCYRYSDDESHRYSYQIPLPEVVNAMEEALGQTGRKFFAKGELFSITARLLGYQRKGASVRAILEEALAAGCTAKRFTKSGNGRIALSGSGE